MVSPGSGSQPTRRTTGDERERALRTNRWPAPSTSGTVSDVVKISNAPVAAIRRYVATDEEVVVDLSLRAWTPVFQSMESILGQELSLRLHGDWRGYQEKSVRATLADRAMTVWVAEMAGVVGFVAARIFDPERKIGEIYMIAVDPDSQGAGVGTALTQHATTWMRQVGMQVAMISTGGDPGHAPARRVYEKADYSLLPAAGYYKAL